MAGLTRYNAIALVPLQFYGLYRLYKRPGQQKFWNMFLPALSLCSWLIVFQLIRNSAHGVQVQQRASWIGYLNIGESFVYLFPYFVTLPIFCLMIWGWIIVVRRDSMIQKEFAATALYLVFVTIAMQTIFQSFQSRYLLPLIPIVTILAGCALARWRIRTLQEKQPNTLKWMYIIFFLIWLNSAAWSTAVLALQRGMWGDIRRAAEFMKNNQLGTTPHTKVFSNEVYNREMGIVAAKLPFWSGIQTVLPLFENYNLPDDSYVVLHSSYGGMYQYLKLQDDLIRNYKVRKIEEFDDWIVPLFPDVMENPGTHQNPAAWFMRYHEQNFKTSIYFVEHPKIRIMRK